MVANGATIDEQNPYYKQACMLWQMLPADWKYLLIPWYYQQHWNLALLKRTQQSMELYCPHHCFELESYKHALSAFFQRQLPGGFGDWSILTFEEFPQLDKMNMDSAIFILTCATFLVGHWPLQFLQQQYFPTIRQRIALRIIAHLEEQTQQQQRVDLPCTPEDPPGVTEDIFKELGDIECLEK